MLWHLSDKQPALIPLCKSAWREDALQVSLAQQDMEAGALLKSYKTYPQQEPQALSVQVQFVSLCSGGCCATTAHCISLQSNHAEHACQLMGSG